MKAFLINPYSVPTRNLPMGLLYVAETILKDGHEVRVLDLCNLDLPKVEVSEIVDEIRYYGPDFVGFSIYCARLIETYQLAESLKSEFDIPFVAGGAHAHLRTDEVLQHGFNIVIRGEGEQTILPIMECIREKRIPVDIPGVGYILPSGERRINEGHPLYTTETVEGWYPPREMVNTGFKFLPNRRVDDIYPNMCIIDSRGCPYQCTFCALDSITGRKYRFRSAKDTVDEIQYCIERFNAKSFWFSGNSFPADRERAIKVCDLLIEQQINLPWKCSANLVHVDEEILRRMYEAGCVGVNLGVESFDPETLKRVRKPQTLEIMEAKLETVFKSGIGFKPMILIGFPGETEVNVQRTVNGFRMMIKRLSGQRFNAVFNHPVPYPGSELYETEKDEYGLEEWWLKPAKANFYDFKYYDAVNKPFFLQDAIYEDEHYIDMFWFWKYSPQFKKQLSRAARDAYRMVKRYHLGRIKYVMYRLSVSISKFLYTISPNLESIFFKRVYTVLYRAFKNLSTGNSSSSGSQSALQLTSTEDQS